MQVILVSDTHGDRASLNWLRKTYPEADAFVHCGDLLENIRSAALAIWSIGEILTVMRKVG